MDTTREVAAPRKVRPGRAAILGVTALNVALLVNLWAVIQALGNFAAGIVWWSGVLLVVGLVSGLVMTVIAGWQRRFGLAALNLLCTAPYVALLVACLVGGQGSHVVYQSVSAQPAREAPASAQ